MFSNYLLLFFLENLIIFWTSPNINGIEDAQITTIHSLKSRSTKWKASSKNGTYKTSRVKINDAPTPKSKSLFENIPVLKIVLSIDLAEKDLNSSHKIKDVKAIDLAISSPLPPIPKNLRPIT